MARVLGRALQAALGERPRRFGPLELDSQRGACALLLAQPGDVLVEQTVVLGERTAQRVQLLDDPLVLFLEALELAGHLRPRLALGAGALLCGAAGFLFAQALELAPQRGGLVLRVGAGVELLFEPLVLVGEHAARLFRRAVVAPGRVLEFGEPGLDRPPTGLDGLRNGDRVDAQDRRRRGCHFGAFPLRE